MESRIDPLKKAQWLATGVLLLTAGLLAGLLGRVFWIQKQAAGAQQDPVARQATAVQPVLAKRAQILARDSTPLATSVRVYNLFADPAFIMEPTGKRDEQKKLREKVAALPADQAEARRQLQARIDRLETELAASVDNTEAAKDRLAEAVSPLLGRSAGEIRTQIESNAAYAATGRPRRFLWLAKEVDDDFYTRFMARKGELQKESGELLHEVRDLKVKAEREAKRAEASALYHTLDGVGFVPSLKRHYPLGTLAGHVLGAANRYEGFDGLEFQLDPILTGRLGLLQLTKDAGGHVLAVQEKGFKPADDGLNVWLTLDTTIQSIAEEELGGACEKYKAESGCAVIMDPLTGRVVAMASWPPLNPNQYQEATPAVRRNKAFESYEPGSIFKPFVMGWALEKHIVTPSGVIDCHLGHWTDPTGRAVTDVHGYGVLSWEDVIVKSSNIGMAQLGWKMGIPTLHEAVKKFGFGERTGIETPGDEKGIVHPLSAWNKGTLTSASFGYEVAATPLQLVRAYAVFANGGYLIQPRIVYAVETEPGKCVPWADVAGPPAAVQIISTQTAATMRKIMEGVYMTGTAKTARSEVYRLFGKTGTAHLAMQGQGHYAGDQYNSSFLCGGPMTRPQLVAVMTLHKPDKALGHFGGTVAAPACTKMLERALEYQQVPADQTAQPRRVTPLAEALPGR